jgi:hypothetical protein
MMAQEIAKLSSIDYDDIPALGIGQKRSLQISTYVELHQYIQELTRILEEVFEMGIMKGTAKRYENTINFLDDDEKSSSNDEQSSPEGQ